MRLVHGAYVLTALALLLAGCAGEPATDGPTSINEPAPTTSNSKLEATSVMDALDSSQPGDEVRVQATLVTEDDVPFLCDAVADSDPEQCSKPKVQIVGAPLEDLGLREHRSELAGEVDLVITLENEVATFVRTASDS